MNYPDLNPGDAVRVILRNCPCLGTVIVGGDFPNVRFDIRARDNYPADSWSAGYPRRDVYAVSSEFSRMIADMRSAAAELIREAGYCEGDLARIDAEVEGVPA